MLQVGDKVLPFSKVNQDGDLVDFGTLLGKQALVIYFYPKNFTPGCTKEACSFRDNYQEFEDLGATVFGVSGDSSTSHARFVKRYRLPFDVISDKGGELSKMFGVKSLLLGLLPGRETFVIDKKGIVCLRYHSINATRHIPKALSVLKKINKDI